LHKRLQLDSGDSLLLNVGSLDQKKGLFVLLDALRILVDSGESVHLALVGDGPLREPLKAKIKDLNLEKNATMLGDIRHEQLPGIFAACDIYVQPSLIEPFGVVVLEAAASAKPVVVTNVPGMREVIPDDVATLVPPGEESALAKAIQNLLGNPELRADKGANARKLVEAKYSWRSVAQDTVDLYQDVLDRGNSKGLS
jgi:glycosyltransferase involved in cell wall biosynthesis